jgi:hypothetical protein
VFVSFGALGVLAGVFAGKAGGACYIPAVAAAVLSLALTKAAALKADSQPSVVRFYITAPGRSDEWVLTLALLSILVRAFGGSALPGAWDKSTALTVALSVGAFAGKFSGGFLADRLGARRVGAAALLLSIPLFLLSNGSPVVAGLGMALFQMTMPVTLCAVCDRLPENPGLAFGLTTAALLAGSAPFYFIGLSHIASLIAVTLLTVLSAGCALLMLADRKRKKNEKAGEVLSKQAL